MLFSRCRNCLPFASTCFHPRVLWWVPCCSSFLVFFVLSYYVSLRSEFRVVMSLPISTWKRCSIRLHLHLFVGKHMSCLRYLSLLADSVFLLCFSSSCVPYVASFSGLSFSDYLSVFSNIYSCRFLSALSFLYHYC